MVRPATPQDLPAYAAIINDYIDDTLWLPRTMSCAEIASLFTPEMLGTRYFRVAEQDGTVGGYLSMNQDEGHVIGLYLSPGWRCKGAGKLLLDDAKKACPDGLKLTVFEPNEHAKYFYEREGFKESVHERDDDTDEGVPTLMMRWGRSS
ncbi:MAG: GNAT family N-acetyltransferase [Pseudomonadota bacterium]